MTNFELRVVSFKNRIHEQRGEIMELKDRIRALEKANDSLKDEITSLSEELHDERRVN
jgi:cell division protein FtsL